MSGYLTFLQRRTPPANDRVTTRRTIESSGGREKADPRTLAVGIDDFHSRYPGTVYDSQLVRDRGPYYQADRIIPPGNNWVSWTAAGPQRPELHMRNVTFREMQGNTTSRYPVANTPSGGLHTMTPPGVAYTVPRYVTTPQMTGARVNRLLPGQYRGQTYSQTTQIQGQTSGRGR